MQWSKDTSCPSSTATATWSLQMTAGLGRATGTGRLFAHLPLQSPGSWRPASVGAACATGTCLFCAPPGLTDATRHSNDHLRLGTEGRRNGIGTHAVMTVRSVNRNLGQRRNGSSSRISARLPTYPSTYLRTYLDSFSRSNPGVLAHSPGCLPTSVRRYTSHHGAPLHIMTSPRQGQNPDANTHAEAVSPSTSR